MKVRIKSREEIKKTKPEQNIIGFAADMHKLCGTIMELEDKTTFKNAYRQTEPDGGICWYWHKDWFDIIEEFEVGDIVEAFGLRGVIIRIEMPYAVLVKFNKGFRASFTPDGRLHDWHKEPSLKLISKAEKKETRYQVLYSHACSSDVYAVTTVKYKDLFTFEKDRPQALILSSARILLESAEEFEV